MAAIPAGMDECRKPVVRVNTSTSAVEARLAQPDARTSSEMRASGAKAPRTKALHMRSRLGHACRSGHRPFVVLYLIPRSAALGAVLWAGYLGGAIATHVRLGNPLFTHFLFPIYVAILIWGGLYLRDGRLRAIFPGGSEAHQPTASPSFR